MLLALFLALAGAWLGGSFKLSEVNPMLMTFTVVQGRRGYASKAPYLAVADVDVPGVKRPCRIDVEVPRLQAG